MTKRTLRVELLAVDMIQSGFPRVAIVWVELLVFSWCEEKLHELADQPVVVHRRLGDFTNRPQYALSAVLSFFL